MEQKEFEKHYNDTRHGLRNYVSGILGSGNPFVDDIVADSYIRAWEKIHQWDPDKGAFSTWVYRIARNYSLRHRMVAKRIPTTDVEMHRLEMEDEVCEVTEERDLHSVETLFRKVPNPNARKALTLYVVDRLSYEEIAKEMGVTLGALKSWIRRGRKQLGIAKFGIQNGRVRKGTSKEREPQV